LKLPTHNFFSVAGSACGYIVLPLPLLLGRTEQRSIASASAGNCLQLPYSLQVSNFRKQNYYVGKGSKFSTYPKPRFLPWGLHIMGIALFWAHLTASIAEKETAGTNMYFSEIHFSKLVA
jgi:hypothetical protein